MKLLKLFALIVYSLFTVVLIFLCSSLIILSSGLSADSTVGLFNSEYAIIREDYNDVSLKSGSLVSIKHSENGLFVENDTVVYKNTDDLLKVGVITAVTDNDGYISYTIDSNDISETIPKLYIIGRIDCISSALGSIVTLCQQTIWMVIIGILPIIISVAALIAAFMNVDFGKKQKTVPETKAKEKHFEVKIDYSKLKDKDFLHNENSEHHKPYVNPNSHTELLKYDWLKQAAGITSDDENSVKSSDQGKKEESNEQSTSDSSEQKSLDETNDISFGNEGLNNDSLYDDNQESFIPDYKDDDNAAKNKSDDELIDYIISMMNKNNKDK